MPRKELISGEWKKVCSSADCHKAGIPQPIEGFSKNKNKFDGLQYKCKKCANTQNAEYNARPEIKAHIKARGAEYRARPENKARKKTRHAEYYAENKAHIKAKNAEYKSRPEVKARILAQKAEYRAQPENKERIKAQKAEYYAQPDVKARKKVYNAEYNARPENKARAKVYNTEYAARPENKARKNQRYRARYHSDPVYRVKCIVSSSIHQALKAKGKTKGGITFDYLPYSPEGLVEHIENLFVEHMTWDNQGTYWHLDHIRPHASFKYDSLDHPEFQECWALENLRPLKASENMSKGSFWEGKRHYHNEEV